MANTKIKVAMVEAGMKQWEVARLMGIHEAVLSRKLRNELPEEEQERIIALIRQHTKKDGDDPDDQ